MIDILYSALHAELGITVYDRYGANPEQIRQKLYSLRRQLQDEALEVLTFAPSRIDPNQLWIYKHHAE